MSSSVLHEPPVEYDDAVDAPANRMVIAVFALIGVLISTYMLLYHMGVIGGILCGTGGCETVQNSPWAKFMGIPVPLIGLVGYGALMGVALAGMQPRFVHDPTIAAALLIAAVGGAAFSIYLSYLEQFVIHAWCRWCIGSAAIAFFILGAALPEMRRLRRQGGP